MDKDTIALLWLFGGTAVLILCLWGAYKLAIWALVDSKKPEEKKEEQK